MDALGFTIFIETLFGDFVGLIRVFSPSQISHKNVKACTLGTLGSLVSLFVCFLQIPSYISLTVHNYSTDKNVFNGSVSDTATLKLYSSSVPLIKLVPEKLDWVTVTCSRSHR